MLPVTIPPQVPAVCKTVVGGNPGAPALQARVDLAVSVGVDIDDPSTLAAALGGSWYVKALADDLLEAGSLSADEAGAVRLCVDLAMLHWKAGLIDLGAIPTPEGWTDGNQEG